MANPEKAAYDGMSDDNYIDPFDEDDSDNERGPIVIVIALITLAALLGVLWVGVNLGKREGQGGPTILRAETAPAKSVPENRGGLQIPHTDKTVFDAISGKEADEPEELLPPPEEPMILPEVTPSAAETQVAENAADAGAADVNAEQAQDALTDLIEEQTSESAAAEGQEEEVQTALAPPPAATPSAAAPAAEPSETPRATPSSELQLEVEAVPEPEENLEAVAAVEEPAAIIVDPHFVQVTSVRTKNDALAAWDRLQGKFGALVANYQPNIQTVDLGSRGIYHRLRVGPLEGRDAAQSLCNQFKQQGQDCLVAK